MEVNVKYFSKKQTHNTNMRYLFMKERVRAGKQYVQNCLEEKVVADFFTTPPQEVILRRFQKMITNIPPEWREPILWT